MDRFDKLSLAVMILFLAGAAALVVANRDDRESVPVHQTREIAADPAEAVDLEKRAAVVRNLIEGGGLEGADALNRELIGKYPYHGEPHMLMGDILMRKQQPVAAIHEYKQAIELNPDYLDRKTPLFQGQKLKTAVGEALAEIDARLRQNPDDEELRGEKKVIYYLYRRIAGSCG